MDRHISSLVPIQWDKGGSSLGKKMPIFYSALLLTGVNLLLRMVSTSFQVFISGRIGAAGVGLLQLVMSVGSLAITAGVAGIRTATMYLTAEELGKNRHHNVSWVLSGCFTYSIVCSGAVSLALYAFAPWVAANWVGYPETLGAIRILAVFLPVSCLCGVMTGYFTAANRIGSLAAVEVAEQAVSMVVTTLFLLFWAGDDPGRACQAVVLGGGCSACVTLLILTLLRHAEHAGASDRIPVASRILAVAAPLAVADVAKVGINTLENLMVPRRLGLYRGVSDPLAAFGTVCGMVFPVLMFPAAILFGLCELLIPELARCNAAGSERRIRYLAGRSLHIAAVYSCVCGGILYLLAGELCAALYSSEEAGRQLQIYALLAPMLYCDAVIDAMNKGLGQQNICVRYNILTAAMDVVLLFLLLPQWGMAGYFISFFVTHLINFILSLRLLLRQTGKVLPMKKPLLSILSAVLAAAAASFVGGFARCAVFLPVFGSLLVLFRVVGKEDVRWIRGLIVGQTLTDG